MFATLTINAGDEVVPVERRRLACPQLCNKGLGANVQMLKNGLEIAPSPPSYRGGDEWRASRKNDTIGVSTSTKKMRADDLERV